jgi:hypothetical protein
VKTYSLIMPMLVAALAGCSTTIELQKAPAEANQKISLKDNRPQAERVYRRDGIREPIQFFGDEDFSSPPLTQFSAMLSGQLAPGAYDLEISTFRVIDIFPRRLEAATVGGVVGALGSMGYMTYVSGTNNLTADNITCLVGGNLQSKPIKASASIPYRISPLAGMVKNDSAFKAAVNACIGQLADGIAKGTVAP